MTEPVPEDVRVANRRLLRHLGYGRVPDGSDDWPEPPPGPVRRPAEVLDRALALHVVVAVAGGADGRVGLRWADALDLGSALFPDERDYLLDAADDLRVEDAARATAVEALAHLLWALGLMELPPHDQPATEAVTVLPAVGQPLDGIAASATVRPPAMLLAHHDLLAGMLWALRADPDLEVGDAPGSLDPYVVRQRHRASAWVLGAAWHDPPAAGDGDSRAG